MAEPLTAEELQQQAERQETDFLAKKKARLTAPLAANDKGKFSLNKK